jgi:hypothetical protein
MAHVWYHCGTISNKGEPLTDIPITIHDGTRANFAVVVKRRPGQSDREWAKDKKDFDKFTTKFYERFLGRGEEALYHEPSYTHPEP